MNKASQEQFRNQFFVPCWEDLHQNEMTKRQIILIDGMEVRKMPHNIILIDDQSSVFPEEH